jgi:pimeloyl-ACP methyl ester carboxylesterase
MPREWVIDSDGVGLSGQEAGEGVPVVLLHGLTATRRYVVMGSTVLERSGHRVVSYDARGHGRSSPAPNRDGYTYELLAADLEHVLDHAEIERAVLAGASMGAHTILAFALRAPERVAGLTLITPAFDPDQPLSQAELDRWDALSHGLRSGGIDGFVAAYGRSRAPAAFQETIVRVIRQRLAEHHYPLAVADALRSVPRSRPFGSMSDLGTLEAPVVVVVSDDEADPEHPFAIGQRYADAIPHARLVTEEPGASPLAWQGSRISHVIAELSAAASAR